MAAGRAAERKRRSARSRRRSAEDQASFVLTVSAGVTQGREYTFEQSATIGRVEQNDIVLVEPGVSRYHARVDQHGGVYTIADLDSANGTRLNGEPIGAEPEVLKDGDYITLAETTFQFSTFQALPGEITAQSKIAELEWAEFSSVVPAGFVSRHRKKLLAAAAAAIVVTVSLVALLRREVVGQSNRSNEPLTYADTMQFFDSAFGFGEFDRSHPDQVIVDFEYLGGTATLQYAAWGIDSVGEVAIDLNGTRVGDVPLTMAAWRYGLSISLPSDRLHKDRQNRLVFNNLRNPPGRNEWEICYIKILQEATLPPDEERAQHHFWLATKAWQEREVEPGNTATALVNFKKARAYLEGLPQRPRTYQEAVDAIDRIERELTQRFEEGRFSFRRAQKVDGDLRAAKAILVQTMRYFREEDFRYQVLKQHLKGLKR